MRLRCVGRDRFSRCLPPSFCVRLTSATGLSRGHLLWIVGVTAVWWLWTLQPEAKPRRSGPFPRVRGPGRPPLPRAPPSTSSGLVFVAAMLVGALIGTRRRNPPVGSPGRFWDWRDLLLNGGRRRPGPGHPVAGRSTIGPAVGPSFAADRAPARCGAARPADPVPGKHPRTGSPAIRRSFPTLSPHEFAQPHGRVRPPPHRVQSRRLHIASHP